MIKEKTISLKEKMWELEDIPDRVNLMKDWYKDETCYIVSAGPSSITRLLGSITGGPNKNYAIAPQYRARKKQYMLA